MDYEQAQEVEVTRSEAKREINLHGLSFSDFVLDCGDLDTYTGKAVLKWLGY